MEINIEFAPTFEDFIGGIKKTPADSSDEPTAGELDDDTKAAIKEGLNNLFKLSEDTSENTNADTDKGNDDDCDYPPVRLNYVTICGIVSSYDGETGKLQIEVSDEPNLYTIYVRNAARLFLLPFPPASGEPITVHARVTPSGLNESCDLYLYSLEDIERHNTRFFNHD